MGILIDLVPSGLTLLGQLLQLWDDGLQQLHNDGRGDVRVNTQSHDRKAGHGSPGEQVQEAQ